MKYMYNEQYGILIYPESWWDVIRIKLTHLLHPSFKKTWKGNPYWYHKSVHTIEHELKKTQYPDECSAG